MRHGEGGAGGDPAPTLGELTGAVPALSIRALGCWCPVGTVKHRPRRQPRPTAMAAPVLTASARPRRRRVKVFAQAFFKRLAVGKAEPYGPKGVRGVLVPGGHRSGPTEAAAETSPCLPLLSKKGWTNVPLFGYLRARSRGYRLRRVRPARCFSSTAAPVKVETF